MSATTYAAVSLPVVRKLPNGAHEVDAGRSSADGGVEGSGPDLRVGGQGKRGLRDVSCGFKHVEMSTYTAWSNCSEI